MFSNSAAYGKIHWLTHSGKPFGNVLKAFQIFIISNSMIFLEQLIPKYRQQCMPQSCNTICDSKN